MRFVTLETLNEVIQDIPSPLCYENLLRSGRVSGDGNRKMEEKREGGTKGGRDGEREGGRKRRREGGRDRGREEEGGREGEME